MRWLAIADTNECNGGGGGGDDDDSDDDDDIILSQGICPSDGGPTPVGSVSSTGNAFVMADGGTVTLTDDGLVEATFEDLFRATDTSPTTYNAIFVTVVCTGNNPVSEHSTDRADAVAPDADGVVTISQTVDSFPDDCRGTVVLFARDGPPTDSTNTFWLAISCG